MCRRGNPPQVVAPWWRSGGLWRAVCLGGSQTDWDCGRRCPQGVLLVARGPTDSPDVVPLHGCTNAQRVGAIASVACSFRRGYRSIYAP